MTDSKKPIIDKNEPAMELETIYAAQLAAQPAPSDSAAPAPPAGSAPIVIINTIGRRSLFREKCTSGIMPGTSSFRIEYPGALQGTGMTREMFQERMNYVNSTAAKGHGCLLRFYMIAGIFAGMICVVALIFSRGGRSCPTNDSSCQQADGDRKIRALVTTLGIWVATAIAFGVTYLMMGYKDKLYKAVAILNEIDGSAGFLWDIDVEVTITYSTNAAGGTTRSKRTRYFLELYM